MIFTNRNKQLISNIETLSELERQVDELNKNNKQLLSSILLEKDNLKKEYLIKSKILEDKNQAIEKIISEKTFGFPWLADAISQFHRYSDTEIASYLKRKSRPAYKSAETIKEVAKEKRLLRKQLLIAQNFVNYYETLFPWITEYVGEDLDDLLESLTQSEQGNEENVDPVLKYIPKAEYKKLDAVTRNQKALDRYLNSRKLPHVIGRDYERYIGYLYEEKGYQVEYVGIEKGLEDLGRDLICRKGKVIDVVQCKCWAAHKKIHEKHINQLYGTAVKHYLEFKEKTSAKKKLTLFPDLIKAGEIKATFVTSTILSDTAMKFSNALGIEVIQKKKLVSYPMIKCNISQGGEKIYHLPFDQQYDKTNVRKNGGHYTLTVKEAEKSGFRRAYRWRGN